MPENPSALRYPYVTSSVLSMPWALLPEQMPVLAAILAHRLAGGAEHPEAATPDEDGSPQRGYLAGAVGVMPLHGHIFPKANMMTVLSGATSLQQWEQDLRTLAGQEGVQAIVLDVDSPGGSVAGLHEAAALVRDIRAQMPVVAVTNYLNASAAYWISSQADEVLTAQSGITGSIGVLTMHESLAVALEHEGVDVSLVYAGKYKTEGNPWEPLTDAARAAAQAITDEIYSQFVAAVADGRGAKAAAVRAGYGEGRALLANAAGPAGLVDGIETLEATVDRLQTGTGRGRSRRRATLRAGQLAAEAEPIEEPVTVPDYGAALGAALKGTSNGT